ncbi:S-layer homology domain-containing protein [Paenibacillus sabinae]|uniref:Peptidase S8 and S53 subtilisin kexin sedolisin n=1 Tax=Paenibacillus sabinae T27 TaxID=1268072 RepID=X4ZH46_9BACL|nr:S-layer homology domain-containing protein [Paenibacillus sabinae]AHV98816.1 peptidase S8 and S53 subtilisin kexin sedolisin [Paenibacillus sabinae T27]
MKSKFKAFTRKFSLFLALAMVISLISVAPAHAAQTTVHITTAQDLVDLANTINGRLSMGAGSGTEPNVGDYYVEVDADIDMSSVTNWQGIGVPQSWVGITGTFDGNGHTISGISLVNTSPVGPKGGLFNLVSDMTIKDLKVSGSITSNRFIGGIVGRAIGSFTMQNCVADMSLTLSGGASNSVGGLVGQFGAGQYYKAGTVTISNSAALGSFTSNTPSNPVGGLIGHIYTGFNVNVINSYVAASLVNAGGITGALVANINYNTFSIPTLSTLNITNTWYLSGMSGSIIGEGTLPPDIDLGNCFSFTAGGLEASNLGPAWENKNGVNVFNGYSYPDIIHPVMPTANPGAGAVAPGTAVTLSTATVGASVYYAVYSAGIDPATVTFGLYNQPIVINSDTTIKAYASVNGEDSDVMTADYTIRLQPVTGVELDQHALTLTPGATGTLTATVAPTDATNKNVIWTTSDSTVATVTYGAVTAVGAGKATITVRTADGSFKDSCEVTVTPAAVAVTGVELDQHAITLTAGATGTLTATVAPTDATNKNVIWTTSDSTVATVTYGVVTAVGAGKATVTVTTEDGSFKDTCQVTVNAAATNGNSESSGGGGTQTPTTTQQTSTTDLGQVIQSGSTVTLQVDAKKVADQLKDAAQSELVINLSQVTAGSGQSKAVQLPAEVINLVKAANKPIVIQDSGLKIVIPSEVLIQGQNMTFSTTQVSSQTVASAPEHVESKAVYSFDAWAGETAVHNFTKSITITLPIPAGVTELGKLGVYYLNETTGQWDYVGGRIVDGKLVFNTNHFSKYMVAESQKTFGDIASHWAKADIEVMVARHVINGTDADTFAPQNNITRAEFAALLSRVLKLSDAANEGTFKDITGSEWYANDVRKAAKAGIIQGSDGNFHPGDSITRQEMAVMINRAYSYAGGKIGTLTDLAFTDKGSISAWANDAVQSVYTLGIINGYPDGSFGAPGHATRAEGTVMLKTFMDKLGL